MRNPRLAAGSTPTRPRLTGHRPFARLLTLTALLSFASSCQSGYVLRQGWGQLALSWRRAPLDAPETIDALTEEQRERLAWVPRVLEFAREELDLEPGDSYTSFLDLGGKPVSYIVIAAHPLALVAYEWCFPIAGCVPYKGYFDLDSARTAAEELRAEGWDVSLRPVEAYSTLGWFDDPILSSMLDRSLPSLVDLLLHETVHRTLYIPGTTEVNESLATHIAREGTRRFLDRHPEAFSRADLDEFLAEERQQGEFIDLLVRVRDDLDALYRSSLRPSEKALRKREIFRTASLARDALVGAPSAPMNPSNAAILLAESYHGLLEGLARLQNRLGGHPRDLLRHLRDVAREDPGSIRTLLETPEP